MAEPRRVLLWNRSGALKEFGGGTAQWLNTARELRALGVEVEEANGVSASVEGFQILHVFGVQCFKEALPVARRAKAAGLKVALSTIYWDLTEARFHKRLARRPFWRLLRGALGRRASFGLFLAWSGRARPDAGARELVALADVLLPNSAAEARLLEEAFGAGVAGRSAVVPNAFTPLGDAPAAGADASKDAAARPTVLEVAHVHPIKNQAGLIRALWDDDARIVLVGRTDEKDKGYVRRCEALARARGGVELIGPVEQRELARFYAEADIHVLPSFCETTGLVTLEAAAAGCAVVSTDRSPAREYLGDDAYYCDPTDLRSIRAAVLRALSERRRVPPEVLGRYTWAAAARATLDAYRWALGGGEGAGAGALAKSLPERPAP